MSKKVIGIAVIAALDLAFIALIQVGWDPSEVSHNIEPPNRYQKPLTQKQSLPELNAPVELQTVSDSEEPTAERTASLRLRTERAATVRHAVHAKKQGRARSRSKNSADLAPRFTDTVIYVKRPEPFQFQQVSLVEPKIPVSEPIVEIQPEQKRKSFFSRAAPIVKKPYEWIRDLVGKLK